MDGRMDQCSHAEDLGEGCHAHFGQLTRNRDPIADYNFNEILQSDWSVSGGINYLYHS